MTLLLASYKGVSFHTTTSESEVGRRLAEHEYPNAEDWYVEDLGRKLSSFQVTAYVSTDCEPEIAYANGEALQAICATPGPGSLVLPPSTFTVAHCRSCRRTLAKDIQGYMTFSLEFIEQGSTQGEAPFQVGLAIRLVSATLGAAASTISDQGGQTLASFGPNPEHLISSGNVVRTSLAVIHDATQVAVVDPGQADFLSQRLTAALTTVTNFENTSKPQIIVPPSTAFVQPETLPAAGAPPADTATAIGFGIMTKAIADYMQAATDTTTQSDVLASQLQQSVLSIGQDPMPGSGVATYPGRIAQTTYATTRIGVITVCGAMMQILAGISMCQAYAQAIYTRRTDAQVARGLMVSTVEQIIYAIDNDVLQSHPGADELMQARDSSSSAILAIIADLRPTVQMTLQQDMPALYLAWRIYQDPNRAQELADRNDAPHPFFMPTSFEALAP